MRRVIIAGNWKMNLTPAEALKLLNSLKHKTVNITNTEIVVCPPFVDLVITKESLQNSNIAYGGQNVFWENKGAFTGEISPPMLLDIGCSYVIVGHSERRQYFGESNETVNKRVKAALNSGLGPIMCIGESLEQREAGKTFDVIDEQLRGGFADLTSAHLESLVLAYEPVWAIGTGKTATPGQAEEVHLFIRDFIKNLFNKIASERLRIQYGGSVKPSNAEELLSQPDIDGALVGGASLKVDDFVEILKAAEKIKG